jgi:hypothetical protein
MAQTFGQDDAAAGLVLQHSIDQVEKGQMLRVVDDDITIQRFTVFFYITSCRAFIVPIQSSV